jgi:hypothetical protein
MPAKANPSEPKQGFRYLALLAGWLIPGAGHLITGRWVRALLLFASITAMFGLGLAMLGHLYLPNTGNPLDILGFIGDLGNGLLYFGSRLFGAGTTVTTVVSEDYGTKFIVVAGLLNFIAAVDAHNLQIGRKQ